MSADLDVQFEEEAKVMPLMSAAKVWSELRTTVVDESVYKTINHLLFVQVSLHHLKLTLQVKQHE